MSSLSRPCPLPFPLSFSDAAEHLSDRPSTCSPHSPPCISHSDQGQPFRVTSHPGSLPGSPQSWGTLMGAMWPRIPKDARA